MNIRSTAPTALPAVGCHLPLIRDPLAFFRSLPMHGDLVRIGAGAIRAVVVCDPGLAVQVLRNDRIFDKGGFFWDRFQEILSDGLATCQHDEHRRQRRLVAPALHSNRISDYAPRMTAQAGALTKSWRDGETIDVCHEMQTLASATAIDALFSDSITRAAFDQAITDHRTCISHIFWRMILPPLMNHLPTPGNRRYRRARDGLNTTLRAVVTHRRASGALHDDLLGALLAAQDTTGDGHGLSDDEIVYTATTFFMAGTEAIGAALTGALYQLSQHSRLERALHTEVDSVLDGRPAVFDDLPNLPLTNRILTETLRVWPPAWMTTRITIQDTRLGAYRLPAGTTLVVSPYLLHHRADLFSNPEQFDPDRWLPTREAPPPGAFMPFGDGGRKCPGDHFGMADATLALATITTRWQLTSANHRRGGPAPRATLALQRLPMTVVSRGRSSSV